MLKILDAIRNPEQATCSRVQAMTLLLEYCDIAAKSPFFPAAERMQYFSAVCSVEFFETLRSVLQSTNDEVPDIVVNSERLVASSGGGGGGGACSSADTGNSNTSAKPTQKRVAVTARVLSARILRRVVDHNPTSCRSFILDGDKMPAGVPPAANLVECDTFLHDKRATHPLLMHIIRFVSDCSAMGVQVCS